MPTAPGNVFTYQVEETKDSNDFNVTVIKCQGRIVRARMCPLIRASSAVLP